MNWKHLDQGCESSLLKGQDPARFQIYQTQPDGGHGGMVSDPSDLDP